jgi:predicted DNA binding CopG/RHH family protein
MKKPRKTPPKFRSEAAERAFWQRNDSAAFIDWKRAHFTRFPNLRTSTRTISLRLPESMLDELKALANQRDIPYQSLLKVFLAERIARERGAGAFRGEVAEVSGAVGVEIG